MLNTKWVVAKVFLLSKVFKAHVEINHRTLKGVSLVYSVLLSPDLPSLEWKGWCLYDLK